MCNVINIFAMKRNILLTLVVIVGVLLTSLTYAQNVGIGIATPQRKLDINGDLRIRTLVPSTTPYNNTYSVLVRDGNGDVTGVNFTGNVNHVLRGNGTFGPSPGIDHDWYEVGTTNPPNNINDNIYTQGNVGIGTAAPAGRLHVVGDYILYSKTGNLVGITQQQVGGPFTMELLTEDAAGLLATRILLRGGANDADIEFYRGARGAETLSMLIDGATGNVGIGTNAPSHTLHVVGQTRVTSLSGTGTRPVYATNIGVLTTTAPVPDVFWRTTGNDGITATHFLGTINNADLNIRTNNTLRFRIENFGARLRANDNGTAAAPNYSWIADPDIGMYRSGVNQLSFSTAGSERVRIDGVGRMHIGAPIVPTYVGSTWRLGVEGLGGDDYVIYARQTQNRTSWSGAVAGHVAAGNAHLAGEFLNEGTYIYATGIAAGVGNVVVMQEKSAATFIDDNGNGGDGDHVVYMISRQLSANSGVLYLEDDYGLGSAVWRVGYWTGIAYRKIVGSGTVSTVVKDVNNKDVMLMAPEAPENLFMDLGVAQLANGKAIVKLDPNLSKNIAVDEKHPLRVFITIEEGWKQCGAYGVTEKTKDHFVVETEKPCNATFTYMVVANRADEYIPGKGWARYSQERWPVFDPPPVNAKLKYPERENDE